MRGRLPQRHDKIRDHELAPLLPKPVWTNLGSLVQAREDFVTELPAGRWLTVRLDGCRWGTFTAGLRKAGLFKEGWSSIMGDSLVAACGAVLKMFGGVLGYTHSDECTVLVPPSETVAHGGCAHLWVSLAGSAASSACNRKITDLVREKGLPPLSDKVLAAFDARVGVFDSAVEALALILWRASDCNMNSASDAIKFRSKDQSLRMCNTLEKLTYLQERNLLPLHRHQAYGSLLVPRKEGLSVRNVGATKHLLNLIRSQPLLPREVLSKEEAKVLSQRLVRGPGLKGLLRRLRPWSEWR